MNQFWLSSATFYYFIEILFWLTNELFNTLFISKDAIFFSVLKHTKVWLSRHQQTLVLNDVDETETQEIKRDVHEIRSAIRH
jgi:hypothetical protein